MADYPVRVEMLSRFLTPRQQAPLIRDLARGGVDIVIGTHRLLQKDISFQDLGLVVIDEEQRFGVKHKETFKRLRHLVDVLTLTATPIPRTLYLSLTGARDLSTINTPPRDRLAVETRVLKYDPAIIRPAIERELNRHGQVYYLSNRVAGIEKIRDKIRSWFPEARVEAGHGRMGEGELSEVMDLFSRGSIDILVCTTIIESGLDIPNANTIVVERADRFGLADLYQLRGRVGRFQRRAYAYFFYPHLSLLSTVSRRRLQALQEFSHLGAGFSLALRDLEIRGAGNILGRRQHGHIAAIGFEFYCRLLRRSVAELKGEGRRIPPPVEIRLETTGEISADYVPAEIQRIRIYKKWSRIASRADLADWEEELKDRFGPLPPAARLLRDEAELKLAAAEHGVTSIERLEGRYVFRRGRRALVFVPAPPAGRSPFQLLIKRLKDLDRTDKLQLPNQENR
jgi:transcription-repair coupling factor (superfamily II helicase)